MAANQVIGRFTHGVQIQRPVIPGHLIAVQSRRAGVIVDHVAITAADSRKAGVEFLADRGGPAHGHIPRQIGIAAHDPAFHLPGRIGIEMHHLTGAVHPRIGAAGTDHRHRMIGHFRQRLLKAFLHGSDTGLLSLPAAKVSAVVFNSQGDAGHQNLSGELKVES